MGQFDSPTEAALTQLKIEHAEISPVGVVVERILPLATCHCFVTGYAPVDAWARKA
jgi:hypothetical protein